MSALPLPPPPPPPWHSLEVAAGDHGNDGGLLGEGWSGLDGSEMRGRGCRGAVFN